MNNVMTNGFCELNENEMIMVDGGATINPGSLFVDFGRAIGEAAHKAINSWCNFWEGYGAYVRQNGLF